MSDELTRRSILAAVGAVAAGALSTETMAADDKKPSAQEISELMKMVGNFYEKELQDITDESVEKARKGPFQEVKTSSRDGEHDSYAQSIFQGTGFFIDRGVWRWQGDGCYGNNGYYYNPKPGAYFQGSGRCTNGRYLTTIHCTY